MRRCYVHLAVLLFFAAHLPVASQQVAVDTISFAQAREFIIAHNSVLKSAATETEAAKAGVSLSDVRPNPKAGIVLERFGANEVEVVIDQTFELGGKRHLRVGEANLEHDAAKNRLAISRQELEAEIVRRFIPLCIVKEKIALVDSIIGSADALRLQIQARVEVGAVKPSDLVRSEIEIERLGLERSELVRELEQTQAQFAVLGGAPDSGLMHVSGTVADAVLLPTLDKLVRAVNNNPVVKTADIEREGFEMQKKLLEAKYTPDLHASVGFLRSTTDNISAPLVGVSMEVPLFNKKNSAQKKVDLLQLAAGERRENMLQILYVNVQNLHREFLEIDKRIVVLRQSTIPKSEKVYSLLLEYYTAGNAGFLDLAAARAEMLRLRLAVLDIQQKQAQILADLMQITSLPIEIVK